MERSFKYLITMMGFMLIWYTITLVGVPILAGFFMGAFEAEYPLRLVFLYSGSGGVFLLGIIGILILTYYYGKKYEALDDNIEIPVHKPWIKWKVFSPISLMFLSFIFFALLGIYSLTTMTFFSEVPVIEQQFTSTGKVLFAMFPAAVSENLGVYFWYFLVLFFIVLFLRKKKISGRFWVFFTIAILIAPLIFTGYGMANHKLRYGASDMSMYKVAGFWAFGGLITGITGSIIPFDFAHIINNGLLELSKQFSSEPIMYILVGSLAFLIIVYLLIYFVVLRRRKTKEFK